MKLGEGRHWPINEGLQLTCCQADEASANGVGENVKQPSILTILTDAEDTKL